MRDAWLVSATRTDNFDVLLICCAMGVPLGQPRSGARR
jgi:hypothetical protein